MINIQRSNLFGKCDHCENKEGLNFVDNEHSAMVLCDKCLQELNRKIVEHLAEKNL